MIRAYNQFNLKLNLSEITYDQEKTQKSHTEMSACYKIFYVLNSIWTQYSAAVPLRSFSSLSP